MTDTIGRWAVTGAGGRIGRALRVHLAGRGVPLRSLDVDVPAPAGAGDEPVACDLADLAGLEHALAGCAGVVHLGAIADEADFHDLAEVNVVGTYHVLEAARGAGVGRVVYASSNRVTGMYPATDVVGPADPPRPDGFYGVSKVAGEALCRLYADKFGLQAVAVRIGSYEEAPSSQRELRTWLSPADACRAFDAAMSTDLPFAVFYAVSANDPGFWPGPDGARAGFHPVDVAAEVAGFAVEPLPPGSRQAGPYAAAEGSLRVMRR